MPGFASLYNEYENTKDICKFCADHAENDTATRFLLVRSLDKQNLKDIITMYSGETTEGNIRYLTEKAYNSTVTIDELIRYIEEKRAELIRLREAELEGLDQVLEEFPIANCGVRNDRIDSIVQAFVRDKSLKTIEALTAELDQSVLPRVRQYALWSYYNQTANDIIELFFLRHAAVIPTLRKIHDIDFFIKVENRIVPFDLKFAHVSDSYFDMASQGITRTADETCHDDFRVDGNTDTAELKVIKAYYSAFKRRNKNTGLPNLAGQTKNDLCERLLSSGDALAVQFVSDMKWRHRAYVPTDAESLYPLEWWNYKYQGERLFCNNNRLFVFPAYTDRFVDGHELKGKTAEIGRKIHELLNNLTPENIHTVRYHYDKDASYVGDYTAQALSTIYYE